MNAEDPIGIEFITIHRSLQYCGLAGHGIILVNSGVSSVTYQLLNHYENSLGVSSVPKIC